MTPQLSDSHHRFNDARRARATGRARAVKRAFALAGLILTAVISAAAQPASAPPAGAPSLKENAMESIGPTPIRFYAGNLSVGEFMNYWGTRKGDHYDGVDDTLIATLKRTSCRSMCDYIAWCIAEPAEGKWDWSFYENNARLLGAAGLGYNVFCWLHFPPRWYEQSDRFVPYVNLETGESIPQLSLWSPDLPRVFDEFYRRLGGALGRQIEFVRLAMPSEYGEIGYCTGMTNWLRPQPAAKSGYWCGDPYAKADFRRAMLTRYGTVEKINRAWGTAFATPDAIAMPDPKRTRAGDAPFSGTDAAAAAERRRWVDFVDWYDESWVGCLTRIVGIVRRHLPQRELIASIGYGQEQAYFGNDEGRYIEAMKRLEISCQTPGAIGYFPTRRNSSACRAWGVPYYTEPPAGVLPDAQLDRIFMDISNGAQTWFDYLPNLDGARPYFREYKQYLTGAPPRTTLAVWHPTLDHWLHPNDPWSKPALSLAEPLRDAAAYEIIDDRMVKDGALDKLGTRQLVLAGANWLDREAWIKVQDWVERGGVLIVLQSEPIADIEGKTDLWERQAPAGAAKVPAEAERPSVGDIPATYTLDPSQSVAASLLTGDWFAPDSAAPTKANPHPVTRRWSAPGGGLQLPLRGGRAYEVEVAASTPAFGAGITIEVDGRPAGRIEPGGGEPVRIAIPAAEAASGAPCRLARLTFATKGFVPSEATQSTDSRCLGAYVHNLVVREADTSGAPTGPPPQVSFAWDTVELWRTATAIGQGRVVTIAAGDLSPNQKAGLVWTLAIEAGGRVEHPEWNAMKVDGVADGILCTIFDDKILFYNTTRQARRLDLEFRESDFATGRKRPAPMVQNIDLPARTIRAVELR